MIVRELGNGQLLCIHQTTHALMAAEFCRHWGNREFARPEPYGPVMLGIAQHDNGWYEWERQPKLRADGYPQDFLHESDLDGKLQLWQRGIDRLYGQHPYAALLLSQHATTLYAADLRNVTLPADIRQRTEEFIVRQQQLVHLVRQQLEPDPIYEVALQDETIAAHTNLLKFGDNASLQVIVPWQNERTLANCPVDFRGTYTEIRMAYHDDTITFAPWPFGVAEFTVSISGYVLNQRIFVDEASYHAVLAAASYRQLHWRVIPA